MIRLDRFFEGTLISALACSFLASPAHGARPLTNAQKNSGKTMVSQFQYPPTGAAVLTQSRSASNLWYQIVPGRDDSEVVFYSRMEGRAEVKKTVNATELTLATTSTEGLAKTWDIVFSGRLLQGAQRDVAFYDHKTGNIAIHQITDSGALIRKHMVNIGQHWKALAAGSFIRSAGQTQQFIGYDRAGKVSLFQVVNNGTEIKETPLATNIRINMQQLLVGNFVSGNSIDELLLYSGNVPYAAIYKVTTSGLGAQTGLALVQELSAYPVLAGSAIIPRTDYVNLLAVDAINERLAQVSTPPTIREGVEVPLQSVIFFDPFTGLAHGWSPDPSSKYVPLSKTMNWGTTWNQVVSVRPSPGAKRTLLFYGNQVTIKVNYLRVGPDKALPGQIASTTLTGANGTPSAQGSIDVLNKAFRNANMHFELDRLLTLRNDVLNKMPQHATDEQKALAHSYTQWFGNPGCLTCAENAAPGCQWGVPQDGTASCDIAAKGVCSSQCHALELADQCKELCNYEEYGSNVDYCDAKCPPPVQRMVFLNVKGESNGSFSSGNDTYVYMPDGSMRDPYFSAHEPGHYFGLNHTHFKGAPTSNMMTGDPAIDDVEGIPNFWKSLSPPGQEYVNGHCDETASIPVPDSGDCFVTSSGGGCVRKDCTECVVARHDVGGIAKADKCANTWSNECVSIAKGACRDSCTSGKTYTFHPLQFNPMAYGMCTKDPNYFQFSPEQLAHAREHLFIRRPELINP